jgi:hypothetical protein
MSADIRRNVPPPFLVFYPEDEGITFLRNIYQTTRCQERKSDAAESSNMSLVSFAVLN